MMKTIALSAGLLFAVLVTADEMERIDKQHKERIDKAQREYLRQVDKVILDTVRRLESLKKSYIRRQKVEAAQKVQERIDELKTNPGGEITKADDDMAAGTITPNTYKGSEKQEWNAARETTTGFLGALMKNDLDAAYVLLDPYTRRAAEKEVC